MYLDAYEQILRLDVTVDHVLLVAVLQGARQRRDVLWQRQRSGRIALMLLRRTACVPALHALRGSGRAPEAPCRARPWRHTRELDRRESYPRNSRIGGECWDACSTKAPNVQCRRENATAASLVVAPEMGLDFNLAPKLQFAI